MVLLALRRSSLEAGLAGAGVAVLIALGSGVDVTSLIDAGLRAGWIAWITQEEDCVDRAKAWRAAKGER